jgi:hypothetical protein
LYLDGEPRERFRSFVRELVGPRLQALGWTAAEGEDDLTGELRGLLIRAHAVLGDDAGAQATASELFEQQLRDPAGRPLQATILALADELAGAAEPVMGKLDRVPAAIVRGLTLKPSEEGSKPLLRDPARDLFR